MTRILPPGGGTTATMVIRTVIVTAAVLVIPLLCRASAGECSLQESLVVESGVFVVFFVCFVI